MPQQQATRLIDWMRWGEACKRIFEYVKDWDLVLMELGPKLKSSKISSFIRNFDLRSRKFQDHKLPPAFWNEIDIQPYEGLKIRWATWLDKKRAENMVPEWCPPIPERYLQRYVFLKRSAV